MLKTKRRIRLCAVLLGANLLFIWGNSLMPGAVSGALSGRIGEALRFLLGIPVNEAPGGPHLLRKLAHFSEFACLGLLLCWLAGMMGEKSFHLAVLPLLGALAAACVDETIQMAVPGRCSSLKDVWIDTCGAAAGIIILLLGHYFVSSNHLHFRRKQQ